MTDQLMKLVLAARNAMPMTIRIAPKMKEGLRVADWFVGATRPGSPGEGGVGGLGGVGPAAVGHTDVDVRAAPNCTRKSAHARFTSLLIESKTPWPTGRLTVLSGMRTHSTK